MSSQLAKGFAVCLGGLTLWSGCQTSQSWTSMLLPEARIAAKPIAEPQTKAVASPLAEAESTPATVQLTAAEQLASPAELAPPAPVEPTIAADFEDALHPEPESNAAGALTLQALEQIALENNPAIRQANATVAKAQGFRRQVGRYPNPSIGYNGTQLDDAGTDQHTAFVTQSIVTADKLGRSTRVLDQEVQTQLWEVEAQRYRVLTDVRRQFYAALTAQRRRDLAFEFEKVTSEGVRIAEMRRKALEGSTVEVLQAEIQYSEVELIRKKSHISYEAAWSELAAVSGIPHMQPTPLVGELRVSSESRNWDEYYHQLVAVSPEVRAACARVARAQLQLGRQEVQAVPNLGLLFGAGHDNGTGSSMINVQVDMPIPVFNNNDGNISAAYGEYCRATQDLQRLQLGLKARLARNSRDFDTAATTVNLYEQEILPRAKKMLQLAEEAYVAGENSFLEILVSRRIFFDSNILYVDALADLAEASCLIDGMLLSGALEDTPDTQVDSALRDQALSQQ
ncbi:TolC family protein [Planctomicrobium sp. SH664]|uniref:TolC family protein n=1 Tax=Planctomicrobium sp. SH664 TaxID=3448125 RepID=UPI003F5B413D